MAIDWQSVYVIYFDLDNTLIDHSAAERTAFLQSYEKFGLHDGELDFDALFARYRAINDELWSRYHQAEVDAAHIRLHRWSQLLDEHFSTFQTQPKADAAAVASFYLSAYDESSAMMESALDVLDSARNGFEIVGLITNGFPEQVERKLTRLNLTERFDNVVISEKVGFAKPKREIFDYALDQSGKAHGSSLVYIGDNYEVDMIGAKNAGWNTVWLHSGGTKEEQTDHADVVVNSLNELNNLIIQQ